MPIPLQWENNKPFLSYKTSYFPNDATVKMSNDCLHENLKINHVKSIHVASQLTTPENTITYHNAPCLSPQILHKHCFQFLLGPF